MSQVLEANGGSASGGTLILVSDGVENDSDQRRRRTKIDQVSGRHEREVVLRFGLARFH